MTDRSGPDRRRAGRLAAAVLSAAALSLAGCGAAGEADPPAGTAGATAGTAPVHVSDVGIHKIHHVVMIIQENRSFDSYFGTYPGADGIPASDGHFTACLPDPLTGGCDRPFHDSSLVNGGGPHGEGSVTTTSTAARWMGSSASPRPWAVAAAADSRECAARSRPPT